MKGDPLQPGELAGTLLAASDWFNSALVARLADMGWPRLNRTQSQVFAILARGPARPAALARRIGITRQSMQSVVHGLVDAELVVLAPDPDDRRSLLVELTAGGRELVAAAGGVLVDLEEELASSIGEESVAALRGALGSWRSAQGRGRDAGGG